MVTPDRSMKFEIETSPGTLVDITSHVERIEVTSFSDDAPKFIPVLSKTTFEIVGPFVARESKTRSICLRCGQYNEPQTACVYCGAPVGYY